MTTYIEEAAAELRKARADNEKRAGFAAEQAVMENPDTAAQVLAEVNSRRMEIAAGFIRLAEIEAAAAPEGQGPEEQAGPEITIPISGETVARLAVLADPAGFGPVTVENVIGELVDHAQQGVYRPGAWERGWLCQAFGDGWLARVEPDDDPDRLSADGRVIFDRPRRSGE